MILLLITSLVYAQDDNRAIVYEKKTEIDFEGIDIEGALVKPQGALLLERSKASFDQLIKLSN